MVTDWKELSGLAVKILVTDIYLILHRVISSPYATKNRENSKNHTWDTEMLMSINHKK